MKIFSTLIFVLWFTVTATRAQQLSKQDELFVDSVMNAHYKMEAPGAVILVAKNGKPVFRKAYGMANLELRVPNKPGYLFPIASMSKQFYAVCILQLAQEGKLSLSDDIRKYLNNYNSHGKIITITNLLTHTSGIPSFTENPDFPDKVGDDFSKDEMVSYFQNDSLMFEPGTDFSYSNSGYMLAALIIEKISGMTFEDYIKRRLFDSLHMTHTFTGTSEQVIPGLVSGYEGSRETYKPFAHFSWSWPYGGGYLITCVDDMLKWDEALYGNSILSQESLLKAWTPFMLPGGITTNYGLGWDVIDYKGLQMIRHDGVVNGFEASAIRIPSQHLYVIVLSNCDNSTADFSNDIALHLAGNPYKLPPSRKLSASQLQKYTGVFEVRRMGARVVSNFSSTKIYRYLTVSNDTLFIQTGKGTRKPLDNIEKDIFAVAGSRILIRFHGQKEKGITSLEWYREPAMGPSTIEPKTSRPFSKDSLNIK